MRPVSARWAPAMAKNRQVATEVTSWRSGTQLGGTVPLVAGEVLFDATADARRRCSLAVPRIGPDGYNWMPSYGPFGNLHPLAPYGQRLRIRSGVTYPDGTTELVDLGWYLITDIRLDGQTVIVTGSCLWQLLVDAKIPPGSLPAFTTQTYGDMAIAASHLTLRTSSQQLLPVVTSGTNFGPLRGRIPAPVGSDRTALMKAIASAWNSHSVFINDNGEIDYRIEPTAPAATAALSLVDGNGGTVVNRERAQSRNQIYNAVHLTATDPATGKVTYTASPAQGGIIAPTGAYGHVPYFYSSNLIASQAAAEQKAAELLSQLSRLAYEEQIECLPNPALELMDTVEVVTAVMGTVRGLTTAIVLPLTAGQGSMRVAITNQPSAP